MAVDIPAINKLPVHPRPASKFAVQRQPPRRRFAAGNADQGRQDDRACPPLERGWLVAIGLLLTLAAGIATAAQGVSTIRLPDWVCSPDSPPLFAGHFESRHPLRGEPSRGTGGPYPGPQTGHVSISGSISSSYYLYIPAGYPFQRPAPVLMVLHGAGGPGTAPAAAAFLRNSWASTADAQGFIVVAPIGSGPQGGGWLPYPDYLLMKAILEDLALHYNVDRSRIYGWGFSAGGHVLHDLALRVRDSTPDIRTLAAYAVSAGVLEGHACPGGSPGCVADLLGHAARKIPIDMRIGSFDSVVPPAYQRGNRDAFLAHGWILDDTLNYQEFPGDHEVRTDQFAATWAFLCPFQRRIEPAIPYPEGRFQRPLGEALSWGAPPAGVPHADPGPNLTTTPSQPLPHAADDPQPRPAALHPDAPARALAPVHRR